MKRIYRALICLVLVVCLLLLSGCKPAGDQAANQTGITQNQNTNMNGQPEETKNKQENTSETEGQQKEGTILNGTPLYINTVGLLGQSESQLPMLLDYETYGLLEGYIATEGKEVYTETFFQDHSVILIGLEEGIDTKFCLTGITYADGVATCNFDLPWVKNMTFLPATGFQYCMITLDTVLPADTRVEVALKSVEVDEDTYQQMAKQYWGNVI